MYQNDYTKIISLHLNFNNRLSELFDSDWFPFVWNYLCKSSLIKLDDEGGTQGHFLFLWWKQLEWFIRRSLISENSENKFCLSLSVGRGQVGWRVSVYLRIVLCLISLGSLQTDENILLGNIITLGIYNHLLLSTFSNSIYSQR